MLKEGAGLTQGCRVQGPGCQWQAGGSAGPWPGSWSWLQEAATAQEELIPESLPGSHYAPWAPPAAQSRTARIPTPGPHSLLRATQEQDSGGGWQRGSHGRREAWGIFPPQVLIPRILNWQEDSFLLRHQEASINTVLRDF